MCSQVKLLICHSCETGACIVVGWCYFVSLCSYEDENTRYVDIGPVNKVINMLACWLEDPNGEPFKKHLPRVYDYLWLAEDGMKMQGYNGSQLWDTSFAVQVGRD